MVSIYEEDEDSEIEGLIGDLPRVEYPKDLYDARKAKFQDQIHEHQRRRKKPGCPFMALVILLSLSGIGFIVYKVFTTVLFQAITGMLWVVGS